MLKERDAHTSHLLKEAKEKLKAAKQHAVKARNEGIAYQKAQTRRMFEGKVKEVQTLKERIKQLQKGSTPQTEGLEFEDKLVRRLKLEFPEDNTIHEGKGGDVIQTVMFERKFTGVIVYECKRTPSLLNTHVDQAYRAKITRKAVFVVLVTTANYNRTWKGFGSIRDVLVASPFAVIPLVKLLRMHLIEMLKAEIPISRRAKIANQLLQHVTSQEFKNPLEEIARTGRELQTDLKDEMKSHYRLWKKRWTNYQKIDYDTSTIHDSLQLVLQGKRIKSMNKPKVQALPLLPSP
ncbi:MAG: DUF2130 domain-containing protein [Nitrososphaera sp.]